MKLLETLCVCVYACGNKVNDQDQKITVKI